MNTQHQQDNETAKQAQLRAFVESLPVYTPTITPCQCVMEYGICPCAQTSTNTHANVDHRAPAVWSVQRCTHRTWPQMQAHQPCPAALRRPTGPTQLNIAMQVPFCCSQVCCEVSLEQGLKEVESHLLVAKQDLDLHIKGQLPYDAQRSELGAAAERVALTQTRDSFQTVKDSLLARHARCSAEREHFKATFGIIY